MCPQRFSVGVFGGERLEFTDDGIAAAAGDLGFGAGGVDQHLVLHQRGGKCVDEREVGQVVQYPPTPFGECHRQMAAGLLEVSRRGGVQARGLPGHESVQIAVPVDDAEPIPRR